MVYTNKDIAHLEVMANLEAATPAQVDIKKVLALNSMPANDLTSDVLALAKELRSNGFISYADELEQKLVAYKTADVHLYRVHDEDGEDLIDRAHPDGDVNMGDGDLGDFHTSVSRHKKIVDVVQKHPTGKLAAYVNACKIALGQDTMIGGHPYPNATLAKYTKPQLEALISQKMQFIKQQVSNIMATANKELTLPVESAGPVGTFEEILAKGTSLDNLKRLQMWFDATTKRLEHGKVMGLSEQTWETVKVSLEQCVDQLNQAIITRGQAIYLDVLAQRKATQEPEAAAKETVLTKAITQANSLKAKLNSWKSIRTISRSPVAIKWIADEIAALDDIVKRYEKVPEDQQEGMLPRMQKEIDEEIAEIGKFEAAQVQ